MERLRKSGKDLVYRCAKQHSEPASEKRGVKVDELILTPLELINRIAALVPAEPATAGCDAPIQSEPAPFRRSQAHYLWAVLIARIYEVFPLLCPLRGRPACAQI